jgi:hypothetical protein
MYVIYVRRLGRRFEKHKGTRLCSLARGTSNNSRRIRSGMICIFSNYRLKIKKIVIIMQL